MENLCPPKEETSSRLSRRPQVSFKYIFFLKKSLFLPSFLSFSCPDVCSTRDTRCLLLEETWRSSAEHLTWWKQTDQPTNQQTNSWPALTMKQEIKGCWLERLRATPPWPSPHPPRWLFTLGWLSARPDTTVTNDNGTVMVEEGGHSQWMFTAQMLIS